MKFFIAVALATIFSITGSNCSQSGHNHKVMEQEVLKAGRDFNELMKRMKSGRSYEDLVKSGDVEVYNRVIATEYTYTSRDGKLSTKAEDMESFKSELPVIESADMIDQKVRIIDNNAAVETGMIRYKGTNKREPFDITKRYTTTWIWREGRWQIIADHTSKVE